MDRETELDLMRAVAIAPTWTAAMGGLLALMTHGNQHGRKWAAGELRGMAAIADRWVESKRLEARASIALHQILDSPDESIG